MTAPITLGPDPCGAYFVISCNGYVARERHADLDAACRACERIETEDHARDGSTFNCFVSSNGRHVGDRDGPYENDGDGPPYDHATATGMYDRW